MILSRNYEDFAEAMEIHVRTIYLRGLGFHDPETGQSLLTLWNNIKDTIKALEEQDG